MSLMSTANSFRVYQGYSNLVATVATVDAAYDIIEAATERTLFRVSEVNPNGEVVRYFEKVSG
jgi:hypothetical protein